MVAAKPRKSIAIVGGGAKAAAIAARAAVLNSVLGWNLEISIFEEVSIGANWSGDGGYTDGEARLCTPAERDLGFPYDAGSDRRVAKAMYAEYSWPAYLVATGKKGARPGMKDWVNRGRRPPSHADFARYLDWAIKKSGAKKYQQRVVRLQALKAGWKVHGVDSSGTAFATGRFDGIVVTGPGPALNQITRVGSSPRIVDGRDFWRDPVGFLAQGADYEEPVVIVGAGGTSAAIAARAIREPAVKSVVIIGDQAALFARTESFFESQIFSEDALWERLAPQTRRDFTDRLNRGVVWTTISDELSKSNKVHFEPGRGQKIEVRTRHFTIRSSKFTIEELKAHFTSGSHATGSAPWIDAGVVVDASGFDTWWFRSLLPKKYQSRMIASTPDLERRKRRRLADRMGEYLELFDKAPGPIHVPTLSQSVGPGFASLMVLGAMSDRILEYYRP